jgi:hypothetical protein
MDMSATVAELLIRNLYDVFGERDPLRRRAAIETLFAPRAQFSDPHGHHIGHAALDEAVSALHAQFPDHVFSALGEVDALQDYGRLGWAFGPPDDPQRITGLDVAIVSGQRISALYTFLDTRSA